MRQATGQSIMDVSMLCGDDAPHMGSARRLPRRLAATAVLALGAALLAPVSTAGAAGKPGLPNGITGTWGTGADATTLTVTWTSPGGTYLEYDVTYQVDSGTVWDPSPSPSGEWTVAVTRRRSEAVDVAQLDSTKTYVMAVRARDRESGRYGDWSISGLIEPAGTPERPAKMRETERKASPASLTVAWDKVGGAAGGYEVRVSQDTATKAWGAVKSVDQPASEATVSTKLTGANLPSGFATSKTYVAQVRSKSASGTCGSGGVLCSRWVQSASFAQLDISGVDLTHVLPSAVPTYVENIAYHMRVDWEALPAELTGVSYQVSFFYRRGNPANHYITTDDNSEEHAIPDSWYQDWEWYSLCNDTDATNDPARGCARPCDDSWSFEHCQRTTPYPKPSWWFNGGPVWSGWIDVDSSVCSAGTSNENVCSYIFRFAAVDDGIPLRVHVRAVNGLTTGPTSEYTTTPKRPPTQPAAVLICAPSGASVRVEWMKAFHNGAAISGYDIALTKAASAGDPSDTTNVSSTSGTEVSPDDPRRCDQSTGSNRYRHSHNRVFSYMFHGVETSRSYSAAVSANNSEGTGPARATGLVGLVPTAPPAPAPPTATVTATSATLTWEAPADDGGSAVTSYGVRYRAQNSDDTWPGWTVHTRTGTGITVTETVGNLTAATTYQFQVQACNATGPSGATACGAWSAALGKTTSQS